MRCRGMTVCVFFGRFGGWAAEVIFEDEGVKDEH
jgi:hypothetical protein